MKDAEKNNDKQSGKEESFPTASFSGSGQGLGSQIGPYKLLGVLGEGGFGIVYLAEQQRPIKRRVALKVIKPGMDSKWVIARFESEEQALALLDHPNIARVFDAGIAETGRPYFVMEYIKGIPLTEHCDRQKLSIEERLELFRQVCEAAQHAHQKGIIHRDIKPSNILVSIEGKKAVPKIIDFGVAKAITQPLTERTLFTEQGKLIGTPEYMSPEQAEMTAQDIDTRSDIYSLGVVLYELLTGTLPFDRKTLEQAGFAEIQRVIREEDPPRPSTKLSGMGEEAERIAKSRHTEVATLAKRLHKELEWIPLKAMRKERARRYQTALELANDIQNYLSGNPLTAGPESRIYRIKKHVRRNRALVIGTVAVLIVLLAGIIVSIIFAIEAQRQAAIARAVNEFLNNDLLKSVAPEQTLGREITVYEVLVVASEKIEGKFTKNPLVEASIRNTIGETYHSLGKYKEAQPHLEKAYQMRLERLGEEHPDTLKSMYDLGILYKDQGRYEKSKELLETVVKKSKTVLSQEHPDTKRYMNSLAWLCMNLGDYAEMDQALKGLEIEKRVELENTLAIEKTLWTKYDEVEEWFLGEMQRKRDTLGVVHPDTLLCMQRLAQLYINRGRYNKAEALITEVVAKSKRILSEKHPITLSFLNTLAILYGVQGRAIEAEQLFIANIKELTDQLTSKHVDVMRAKISLADFYREQKRYAQAESLLTEVLESSQKTLTKGAFIVQNAMRHLGWLYEDMRRYENAESIFQDLFENSRRIYGNEHFQTLNAMWDLTNLYVQQNRRKEAEDVFDSYVKGLSLQEPETFEFLGRIYVTLKRYDQAIEVYEKALALQPNREDAYSGLGISYQSLGRDTEAAEAYEKAISIKPDTAWCYFNLASVYNKLDLHEKAVEACNKAIQLRPDKADTYRYIGLVYNDMGKFEEAIEAYNQAISIEPDNADIYISFARTYRALNLHNEAIEACNTAIKLKPTLSSKASAMIGEIHAAAGSFDQAMEAYEHALRLDPNDVWVYYSMGGTYDFAGRYGKAIKAYEHAISLKPNDAGVYYILGGLYKKVAFYDKAIESYKKAISIEPNLKLNSFEELGTIYFQLRRYEEATQPLKKALDLDPKLEKVYSILGLVYQELGRYDEAIKVYKQALSFDPDMKDIQKSLRLIQKALEAEKIQPGQIAQPIEDSNHVLTVKSEEKRQINAKPVFVGEFGDVENLSLEGANTFEAKEIRDALLLDTDFLLASHHMAPFSGYLEQLQEKVLAGYRHSGFPEAQVAASFDKHTQQIIVKVVEGFRYFCGDIKVSGAKTLAVEQFIARLAPILSSVISIDGVSKTSEDGERSKLQRDESKNDFQRKLASKKDVPSSLNWWKREPVSFSGVTNSAIKKQAKKVLSEMGYFSPKFEVRIIPEPNEWTTLLLVEIEDEGPKGTIDEIEVSGNKKNSRKEILEYLGLKVGMEFNQNHITMAKDLLWKSARFLDFKVALEIVDGASPKLRLKIHAPEYEQAPPLSEDFSPMEKTLLKLYKYLESCPDRNDDFVFSLRSPKLENNWLKIIFSLNKGLIAIGKKGKSDSPEIFDSAVVVSKKVSLYSPYRQSKLIPPKPAGQMITRLHILPNSDPKDKSLFFISFGMGFDSAESSRLINVDLKLAPSFFVYMAHKDNIMHSIDGNVATVTDKNLQIKVNTDSGRLIELKLNDEKGSLNLTIENEAFSRAMTRIEESTAESTNKYDPQRPYSSTVSYLLKEPILQKLFMEFCLSKEISPEKVTRSMIILSALIDKKKPTSNDDKDKFTSSDEFSLPMEMPDSIGGLDSLALTKIPPMIFKFSNDVFPKRSWPWTLAHESVFVLSGKGKYTMNELKRIYESEDTGPIGFLVTAQLLTYINSPLAPAFADRALEKLSINDFRKDYRLILQGNSVLTQYVEDSAIALRDLEDEEVEVLTGILEPEQAMFIRYTIQVLREGRDRPTSEILARVFDDYWEKILSKQIPGYSANVYLKMGATFRKQGHYDAAIEAYKEAIRLKPDYVRAHNNLGLVYIELEQYQDAVEAYKLAIRIKPDYADAHYNLGVAYSKLGDRDLALEQYEILNTLNKDMASKLLVGINK